MILDLSAITQYVKQPYNKELLEAARKKSRLLTMYVTGEKLKEHLESLPYFEKDELTSLRRRLSRSTIEIFERLLAPTEKVFTAKGGSESYNLPESKENQFKVYLQSIRRGMSLKEWLQWVAFKASLLDPMSLTYNEIDQSGKVYPTYKSTDSIHDYQLNGRQPEYVIFCISTDEQKKLKEMFGDSAIASGARHFRVVDDAFEYFVEEKDNEVKIIATYPNPHQRVPGKINGNRYVFNSDYIDSELVTILELEADFYNDNCSKTLLKKYQMHAKEWGVEVTCRKCEGSKVHNGEDCDHCNATGIEPALKVAQRASIAIGEDGAAKAPIPPMGYVTPPIEAADMINEELDRLLSYMFETFWDAQSQAQTQGANQENGRETATEVLFNEKHKEPKLK